VITDLIRKMNKTAVGLTGLNVIGFSSTIEVPTLPRKLASVFQRRESPSYVYFPPYSLQSDQVLDYHQGNWEEFEEFESRQQVTRLPEPIPAQPGYCLWVDPDGKIAYKPREEVLKAFEDLYTKHLKLARDGLFAKDYETAMRHALVARACAPKQIAPLVIRGAIERILNQQVQYEFTRYIAEDIMAGPDFDNLVNDDWRGVLLNS